MHRINVGGTRTLLEAARNAGTVDRFVYTSSASVTYDGVDTRAQDETAPYPQRYLDVYSETKMLSEKMVLEANRVYTRDACVRACVRACARARATLTCACRRRLLLCRHSAALDLRPRR